MRVVVGGNGVWWVVFLGGERAGGRKEERIGLYDGGGSSGVFTSFCLSRRSSPLPKGRFLEDVRSCVIRLKSSLLSTRGELRSTTLTTSDFSLPAERGARRWRLCEGGLNGIGGRWKEEEEEEERWRGRRRRKRGSVFGRRGTHLFSPSRFSEMRIC